MYINCRIGQVPVLIRPPIKGRKGCTDVSDSQVCWNWRFWLIFTPYILQRFEQISDLGFGFLAFNAVIIILVIIIIVWYYFIRGVSHLGKSNLSCSLTCTVNLFCWMILIFINARFINWKSILIFSYFSFHHQILCYWCYFLVFWCEGLAIQAEVPCDVHCRICPERKHWRSSEEGQWEIFYSFPSSISIKHKKKNEKKNYIFLLFFPRLLFPRMHLFMHPFMFLTMGPPINVVFYIKNYIY